MDYLPRHVEPRLRACLAQFPCVAVTGPRQAGKSTLVRHVFPDAPYVSFDDPDEEYAVRRDPRGFLARFPSLVILDEVQRVPELFRYLKLAIDAQPRSKGRFLLTGSNQFSLHKGISESLAGRVGLLELLPFETGELPARHRAGQLLHGSYPGPLAAGYKGLREWYASYVGTYLEKDVRMVFDIGKLADFQVLLRLLAARTAQEANAASLAKEIGVTAKTVDAWTSVLEAGYILFRLPPYHGNIGKRLIKRPKLYFFDTGLVCHLTGLRDAEALEQGPLAGPVFETLVVAELVKAARHAGRDVEFFFYRDQGGAEIDLVLHDRDRRTLDCIEIKSGQTAKTEWSVALDKVAPRLAADLAPRGTVMRERILYRGQSKTDWPRPGVDYLRWTDFLEAWR